MSIRTALISITTIVCILSIASTSAVILTNSPVRITAALLVRLLMLLLVLLLVSIILGYFLAQPQRRRLYEIEEAAVLLAAGRLQHRVAIMGNGDEIDSLATRFNEMGTKLQQQVKMLQDLAEENTELAEQSDRWSVLEERQRLARELHDSVSQQLFALNMLSATALRYYETSSEQLAVTLRQINDLTMAAQREMRALLLHLRPVELAGRTLAEACQSFLEAVAQRHNLPAEFQYEVNDSLPAAVEEHLFRILQEAVANVLKHARAEHLELVISGDATRVEMTVLDDGVGIQQDINKNDDSYGIKSMRERAETLGGALHMWSRAQGTGIRVVIPLVAKEEGDKA